MLRFHADKLVNLLNILNLIESLLNKPDDFFFYRVECTLRC
jgi:hypothetical protein